MGGDTIGGEGVLSKAGPWMATAIGMVAVSAMAEAGWNLGRFVLEILHLPIPLAVMFPLILEAVAGTFAVQDLRDRRQGHDSPGMRAATYLTLVASSTINGVVGVSAYGPAGTWTSGSSAPRTASTSSSRSFSAFSMSSP